MRSFGKKRKSLSQMVKKVFLYPSWDPHKACHQVSPSPCLQFFYHDPNVDHCVKDMKRTIDTMANVICPILLDTAIKGDPRVHSTKIIWVSPGTTPWVGTSSKRTAGEVALEVVIEKDMAKKNGDAWRVAVDCCLPLMHLIDTTRSIPYGIQQIQDYLGISSAFDQSIQVIQDILLLPVFIP
ncbi:unnamed protein product [Spirodela intermedia]|uniref:DNA-directed RNA polymerase n=1 Tax=Spirodela intermedia TaxID=51605 RepID=A0A7I8KB63_SPIIN|nr:unnamed protein product [Spirodela intermedia]